MLPGFPRRGEPPPAAPVSREIPTGTRGPTGLPMPPPAVPELELVIDPIAQVQRQLLARADILARYPNLTVSGVMDGPTKAAVAEFQHSAGLIVTGAIDRATEIALGTAASIPSVPAVKPATNTGALARLLRDNAKVVATVIGMALTVLTLIDGLGFIPSDARDIVAVMLAALTPLAVYFLPNREEPTHARHRG